MPSFDPREQRLVVNIVYDGVARAGKTTNLRQLCALFAAQRKSELESHQEVFGRTLAFDWMQVHTGVACGFPLVCQILTVPGQAALSPRRRALLEMADAVVYVSESTAEGASSSDRGLVLVDEVARSKGGALPIVIQANKQDQADAVDGATLVRMLGRPGANVVEAIANAGVGVVDTFVAAVRAVVRSIQARAESGELDVEIRRPQTSADILARVSKYEVDPELAAEMFLEEAEALFAMELAETDVVSDDRALGHLVEAARDLADSAPRVSDTPPAIESVAVDSAVGESVVLESTPIECVTRVLPSPDVPTGFIWPAHTGRATVRSLELVDASVLIGEPDGVVTCLANAHVARTSIRSRYADREAARQALVRSAREHTQLGTLLPTEVVLVAQPAEEGACFVWTVRPDMPTVASMLARGEANAVLLAAYGIAVVDAIRASLKHGFTVTLAPSSFGVEAGRMRYVGEVSATPPDAEALADGAQRAARAIEARGGDTAPFLEAVRIAFEQNERSRAWSSSVPIEAVRAEGRAANDLAVASLAETS